jgi:hypothetical protein
MTRLHRVWKELFRLRGAIIDPPHPDPLDDRVRTVVSLLSDGFYLVPIEVECFAQRLAMEGRAYGVAGEILTSIRTIRVYRVGDLSTFLSISYETLVSMGLVYWLDRIVRLAREEAEAQPLAPNVDTLAPTIVDTIQRRARVRNWRPTEA